MQVIEENEREERRSEERRIEAEALSNLLTHAQVHWELTRHKRSHDL
jgi:hypothetical protein